MHPSSTSNSSSSSYKSPSSPTQTSASSRPIVPSGLSSSTLDRTQTQYERKLARQKQLDMMEAAAAGRVYLPGAVASASGFHNTTTDVFDDDNISSKSERSSLSRAPDGAIESARRFLWDEDEENIVADSNNNNSNSNDPNTAPLRSFAYDQYADRPVGTSSQSSRTFFGSLLGIWTPQSYFTNNQDESDTIKAPNIQKKRNLAPQRFLSRRQFDAQVEESDEYGNDLYHTNSNRSRVSDCLYSLVRMCNFRRNPRRIIVTWIGLGLFIFAIIAIVYRGGNHSRSNGASSPTVDSSSSNQIQDQVRYDTLRQTILDSQFTSMTTLDMPGTAQNYALRWITDQDPANLLEDDDALLERYALATFYFSTYIYAEIVDAEQEEDKDSSNADDNEIHGGWTYTDYWMSEKGICMWFGVSCAPRIKQGVQEVHYNENSNVLRLNLTYNNLRGVVPSELSALENLMSLDLGSNYLQGKIPTSLATMKALGEIYLEDNLFTGNIPSEFGVIKTLRDLFLGSNQLTGSIPTQIGTLTSLRALGLDENLLIGPIPNLWKCTNLLILYLDSNQLTGTIAPDIRALSQLMDLRLRKNALVGSIPSEIHALSHLELLYVDDNRLVGSIPTQWDLMPRLQEIQVYKNQLTGTLPNSISTLRDLKVLYADNNLLNGSIPASFGLLGDLQILYLFNNQLTGTLPSEVGAMKNLMDVQLYNNHLNGTLPSEFGKCYKLQKLEVQDNQFHGIVPSELGSIENLQMLKLYRNVFTGTMPTSICKAKEKFDLGFLSADCNLNDGGTLDCDCCSTCYP